MPVRSIVSRRKNTRTSAYRLRGQVGDRELRFLLERGSVTVGSALDNDVSLPVEGVSRHHARLSISDSGVTFEDLGSKNGTFVAGEQVGRSPLSPGDRICFGPVELELEAIDPRDSRLGLSLGEPRAREQPAPPPDSTVALGPSGSGLHDRWLTLVGVVLERLHGAGERDPQGACAQLAEALGVGGLIVAEAEEGRDPVVIAAREQRGGSTTLEEIRRCFTEARNRGEKNLFVASETSEGEPLVTAVIHLAEDRLRGITLRGEFEGHEESACLLLPVLWTVAPSTSGGREEPKDLDGEGLHFPTGHVIGRSPPMRRLYGLIRSLAYADEPVLITGETGVGKEHVARLVHDNSPRCNEVFVAVNCAAIPADLLEAEMFGLARGAATGVLERPGKFAEADRGTLFLDEVGEMPPRLQAKLLRALEEGEAQAVGGPVRRVDTRVVAATNVDLEKRIDAGAFRSDLYYRLAAHVIQVPPLRERTEDLPQLLERFLRVAVERTGKRLHGLSVGALETLTSYPWPGNVREFQNEIRRLVYACPEGQIIDSTMISPPILRALQEGSSGPPRAVTLPERLESLERELIVEALREAGGNRTRAAELLGIHRNSLAQKMKRLGVDDPARS